MKRLLIASLALLLTLTLSSIIGPSNAEVQNKRSCLTRSSSLTTNCLAIRTTQMG
jgi:hypothetical protein